ncbi:MAG: transcription elongation factor GreA [Bacteroidales bacterium]|nr:transcription elongation factor GreA [Candidatus Physcousia equi]
MEYLSKECYDELVAELNDLINVQLPKVKNEIAEARDKGDLSENFEYHAAKRAQGKLLGRIRFKQRVLQYARVMDMSHLDCDTVGLFRKVEMTNLNNNTKMTYTIVNPHEANLHEGKLSIKSPIAQGIVGKRVGEIVEIEVPSGLISLRVDGISIP